MRTIFGRRVSSLNEKKKALSEPQQKRLGKSREALLKDTAAMFELLKTFEGTSAEYLPAPAEKKAKLAGKQSEVVTAELAMAAEPTWSGLFATLMDSVQAAKKAVQEATRSVKVYAEEAKAAAEPNAA